MEDQVTNYITKHTSLRILRSEGKLPDIINGVGHQSADSTTFKCSLQKLDSLIQEDVFDSSQQIKTLTFCQLAYPPPNLSTILQTTPCSSVHMYSFVHNVEFGCPLDIRWVFHEVLPFLPKLSFLRFGAGCFERFYYDDKNGELNQHNVQLLALKWLPEPTIPAGPTRIYPEVCGLDISVANRQLSDGNYPWTALIAAVNLILGFTKMYLRKSLSSANLNIPAVCAIDSFLHTFPNIKAKGQRIEDYENNLIKFSTTTSPEQRTSLDSGHNSTATVGNGDQWQSFFPPISALSAPTNSVNICNPTLPMPNVFPGTGIGIMSGLCIHPYPISCYGNQQDEIPGTSNWPAAPTFYGAPSNSFDQFGVNFVENSHAAKFGFGGVGVESGQHWTASTSSFVHLPNPVPMENLAQDIIRSIAREDSHCSDYSGSSDKDSARRLSPNPDRSSRKSKQNNCQHCIDRSSSGLHRRYKSRKYKKRERQRKRKNARERKRKRKMVRERQRKDKRALLLSVSNHTNRRSSEMVHELDADRKDRLVNPHYTGKSMEELERLFMRK